MKEVKENVNKKKVIFKKTKKIMINNEIREYRENTTHEFEQEIADRLVSQNVAEYVSCKEGNKKNGIENQKEVPENNIVKKISKSNNMEK